MEVSDHQIVVEVLTPKYYSRFHRSMTRPFFSRDRISHFHLFERHADHAIALMKERLQQGYALDVQDVFSRFTLDSASEFLFGSCVDSLKSVLPYPHDAPAHLHARRAANLGTDLPARFSEAFARVQNAISVRLRLGDTWPMWELFTDKTKDGMEIVDAFLQPILQQALAKKRENKGIASVAPGALKDEIAEDETLLDHLVKLTDGMPNTHLDELLTNKASDQKLLKDELLNIMIAGRDTVRRMTTSEASYLPFLSYHEDCSRFDVCSILPLVESESAGTSQSRNIGEGWQYPITVLRRHQGYEVFACRHKRQVSKLHYYESLAHLSTETLRLYPVV